MKVRFTIQFPVLFQRDIGRSGCTVHTAAGGGGWREDMMKARKSSITSSAIAGADGMEPATSLYSECSLQRRSS